MAKTSRTKTNTEIAEEPVAAPTLAQSLQGLEDVVRRLERGEMELEEAIRLYREGADHVLAARVVLQTADLEVERVVELVSGALQTEPVEQGA